MTEESVSSSAANPLTVLLLGATGATGRLLLAQLLARGHSVRAIVRGTDSLPEQIREHPGLALTRAPVLELDGDALQQLVLGCDAVASCLGHTLGFKGIFGPPRKLVTRALRRVCVAVADNRPAKPARLVVMGSSGVRNADADERISLAQAGVSGLLRWTMPPHRDNELAAEFLRTGIGQDDAFVEWAVVRPDSLENREHVSRYVIHPSPIRSAIFDPGTVSRVNVAQLMRRLIEGGELWEEWKGRMPVIYGREPRL